MNIALPPGTGDAGWLRAFHAVVPDVVKAFRPDVLVTQHGCDSHMRGPAGAPDEIRRRAASGVPGAARPRPRGLRRQVGRHRRRRLRDHRRRTAGLDAPAGDRRGPPDRPVDAGPGVVARGRADPVRPGRALADDGRPRRVLRRLVDRVQPRHLAGPRDQGDPGHQFPAARTRSVLLSHQSQLPPFPFAPTATTLGSCTGGGAGGEAGARPVLEVRCAMASKKSGGESPLAEVKFLTVAEVATAMRVSKMTVYRLVHSGELPAVRVGRFVPGVGGRRARLPQGRLLPGRITTRSWRSDPSGDRPLRHVPGSSGKRERLAARRSRAGRFRRAGRPTACAARRRSRSRPPPQGYALGGQADLGATFAAYRSAAVLLDNAGMYQASTKAYSRWRWRRRSIRHDRPIPPADYGPPPHTVDPPIASQ